MHTYKKITFLSLFTLIAGGSTLTADTMFSQITVMDRGVKRIMQIPKTDNKQSNNINTQSKDQSTSKEGIIVKFKKHSTVNIEAFESSYGLKLKHKLITGYYIFTNVSDSSDIAILERIIENEKKVETVKPNWKRHNKLR